MSFILDALKKSESDRQRQTGPALFEVKVAPPKARFPTWAVAIAALLVVNMCIVGWLLLRHSSRGEEAAPTSTGGGSANTAPASGPVPAAGSSAPPPPSVAGTAVPPTAPPFNGAPPGNAPPATNMSPGSAPTSGAPPAGATPSPPASAQGQLSAPENQPRAGSAPPRLPARDQNEPTLAANGSEGGRPNAEPGANPDDFAPAAEPGSLLFKGHVKRGTESGFPLYQDAALAAGSNLPQLRLDLHVYAAKPQDRFALINMHKLHEGDSVQNGIVVDSIIPDGVVMSHNGSKFLLPRE
jgi:general secretion pathway protein B